MDIRFDGKTVLITGASSGIGQATAKAFAQSGARVLLLDLNLQGMIDTVKTLDRPSTHEVFVVNVGKKEEIDKFWCELAQAPDILINNAGIYPTQDFLTVTEDDFQKTINVNTNSVFWMCQQFINRRGKKGGVMVNTASIEAILPFKRDLIPYCVSKAGVIALTRSLARDYGRKGFRANVVLPGAIKTSGTRFLIMEGIKNVRFDLMQVAVDFGRRLAMGRWGRPEEVAEAILYLSSDKSSYIQGAVIPVDGGFLSS